MNLFLLRITKLWRILWSPRLVKSFFACGVLAAVEHRFVIRAGLRTVVDVGANRGQFALAVRHYAPQSRIVSFEPLAGPAAVFRQVFAGDDAVELVQAAIGPEARVQEMHVSARDDSSSLLEIAARQENIFPGTHEVGVARVEVGPLNAYISAECLEQPAMLKLDVQGFELESLRGCESLLDRFECIYCECSFVELYQGQRLAGEVIGWLANRGFLLAGVFNVSFDRLGSPVQADFLFIRGGVSGVAA